MRDLEHAITMNKMKISDRMNESEDLKSLKASMAR